MPLNRSEATALARREIQALGAREGFQAELVDSDTVESAFGWLFFYDTPEFIRTGDPAVKLIGNAPIIVHRGGQVFETGTRWPLEVYLRPFFAQKEPTAG